MSIKKIKIEIKSHIMAGHVSFVKTRCSNRACYCFLDESKMHGPYYRWTGIINGKRITKNISPKVAKECEYRIKNYQKLLREIDEVLEKSLRTPPWDMGDDL